MLNMDFSGFFTRTTTEIRYLLKEIRIIVYLILKGHVRIESISVLLTELPKTKPNDQEHHP